MAENSKQNLITAASLIIALVAVVYALMQSMPPKFSETHYRAAEENPVVLKLDGRDVTRMEVLDNFASTGARLPEGEQIQQIFPLLQEQYIVTKLFEKGAQNYGIDIHTPEVAERVAGAVRQAERAVYIDKIGEDAVTEAALRKAYDDVVGNAEEATERHARHILLDTEGAANAMIVKLQGGSDFAKLAEENSKGPTAKNGGDLGYFTRGEMVPEFAEAAFTIEVGSFGDKPVQTQFGWHVIKVEDERMREKPAFEAVKPQLEQQLRQAVVAEKLQELRDAASVEIFGFDGQPREAQKPAPEEETTEQPKDDTSASESEE